MHLYTHITRNFDECVICLLVFDNVCGCFARLEVQLDMHALHECTHARTQIHTRTRARTHVTYGEFLWRMVMYSGTSPYGHLTSKKTSPLHAVTLVRLTVHPLTGSRLSSAEHFFYAKNINNYREDRPSRNCLLNEPARVTRRKGALTPVTVDRSPPTT